MCSSVFDKHMPVLSKEEWKGIDVAFTDCWNHANCVGSFDGKHLVIKSPHHHTHIRTDTPLDKYKGTYCIVLLAAVEARCVI